MNRDLDLEGTIINSLMDVDFYKFTMGQMIFFYFFYLHVTFGFTNRTKDIRLPENLDIKELERQLDHARTLRFNRTEIHYLRGTNEFGDRMFQEPYLQFLEQRLALTPYELKVIDGGLYLRFSGPWAVVTYWETIALSIINELYTRQHMKGLSRSDRHAVIAEGERRLREKIALLKMHPEVVFTDFGTRRRFSRDWQDYVIRTTVEELPDTQFLGTSNAWMAMKHGILPMGTSAHELPMVIAAFLGLTDEHLLNSQQVVNTAWWNLYGHGLSIALPDTFGSDAFFRSAGKEWARDWKGSRHDSGDPFEYGEKKLRFYEGYGVDPREKMVIFSDGLKVPLMIALTRHFMDRIKVSHGIGTHWTFDMGLRTISIVIKAIEVDGRPTVKLSDNLEKAIGPPEEVARYKRVFGYTNDFAEVPEV